MKKLFLILMIALLSFGTVAAQKTRTFPADTTTNADTLYFTYPTVWSGNWEYAIGITLDSISGTVLAASVQLQAAVQVDSVTRWVNVGSPVAVAAAERVGTTSPSIILTGTTMPALYYRVRIITSGTNRQRGTCTWVWKPK
jgi:hypothetical protein